MWWAKGIYEMMGYTDDVPVVVLDLQISLAKHLPVVLSKKTMAAQAAQAKRAKEEKANAESEVKAEPKAAPRPWTTIGKVRPITIDDVLRPIPKGAIAKAKAAAAKAKAAAAKVKATALKRPSARRWLFLGLSEILHLTALMHFISFPVSVLRCLLETSIPSISWQLGR